MHRIGLYWIDLHFALMQRLDNRSVIHCLALDRVALDRLVPDRLANGSFQFLSGFFFGFIGIFLIFIGIFLYSIYWMDCMYSFVLHWIKLHWIDFSRIKMQWILMQCVCVHWIELHPPVGWCVSIAICNCTCARVGLHLQTRPMGWW